jgi:hypothetical protein
MFNSTATNITAESLNTELEQVVNTANGTVGNSLVLGQIEGGRLFIIEGIDMGSNFNHIVPKWKYSVEILCIKITLEWISTHFS